MAVNRLNVGATNQLLAKASTGQSTNILELQNTAGVTVAGVDASGNGVGGLFRTSTFKNLIINGGFNIWQRGTSFAATGSVIYGADRWSFFRAALGTGATVSRQSALLTGFQYSARVQRDSGNTSTEQILATQVFESVNSIPLAGKNVVYSFWAKAGANFSGASSAITVSLQIGTGTDQSTNTLRFGGWTGQTSLLATTQVITTTWTKYQFTATVPSTATQISVSLGYNPVGTASTNDWFEITGVQLEVGSTATDYEFKPIDVELAQCQRYFQELPIHYGEGTSVNTKRSVVFFSEMRATPTGTLTIQVFDGSWKSATSTSVSVGKRGGYVSATLSTNYFYVGHGTSQIDGVFEAGKLRLEIEL